jgi:hypothetical protein
MTYDEEVVARALAAMRGTMEQTAFRVAALSKADRATQLSIVREAHEDSLKHHGYDAKVDPGKTYVAMIMKGIELLLVELDDEDAKN